MIPTREINGIRPSPLKIHTDSSLIKKPAGLSAITNSIPSSVSSASHRQPVIIYTHSPKIIHTQASEFMFLVQKLTGFSGSSNDDNDSSILPSANNDGTPIASKRRKTSIGKQKDDSIKSSTKDTLQLVPQQWPSVAPTTTDLEFNPLHEDASSFMQGFSSEFFDLPNSSYKCTELPRISSMSNFNSSSPRFSDI